MPRDALQTLGWMVSGLPLSTARLLFRGPIQAPGEAPDRTNLLQSCIDEDGMHSVAAPQPQKQAQAAQPEGTGRQLDRHFAPGTERGNHSRARSPGERTHGTIPFE